LLLGAAHAYEKATLHATKVAPAIGTEVRV